MNGKEGSIMGLYMGGEHVSLQHDAYWNEITQNAIDRSGQPQKLEPVQNSNREISHFNTPTLLARMFDVLKPVAPAVATVTVIAACQSAGEVQIIPPSQQTPSPEKSSIAFTTAHPEITATPTPAIVPSEEPPHGTPPPSAEVTPSPTVKPTPEATPKPTSPITRESVLKDLEAFQKGKTAALDKYKKPISLPNLTKTYNEFLKLPNLSSDVNYKGLFKNCTKPEGPDQNAKNFFLITGCTSLTYYPLKLAEQTADPVAIAFAQDMIAYDININTSEIYVLDNLVKLLQVQP